MHLKVVSYNIHKGLSTTGTIPILQTVKQLLVKFQPDVVLLQEVVGDHTGSKFKMDYWPNQAQFEFLADEFWPHYAYGQNALYNKGHHGNCILSKFPITQWKNIDISTNRLEQRGLLHASINIPSTDQNIDLLSTHLNLLKRDRNHQILKIINYIKSNISLDSPLIFCGDFNDWQSKITTALEDELGLKEVYKELYGDHAKTFPSFFPILKLDRIYYRNINLNHKEPSPSPLKLKSSDHLPVFGHFEL